MTFDHRANCARTVVQFACIESRHCTTTCKETKYKKTSRRTLSTVSILLLLLHMLAAVIVGSAKHVDKEVSRLPHPQLNIALYLAAWENACRSSKMGSHYHCCISLFWLWKSASGHVSVVSHCKPARRLHSVVDRELGRTCLASTVTRQSCCWLPL